MFQHTDTQRCDLEELTYLEQVFRENQASSLWGSSHGEGSALWTSPRGLCCVLGSRETFLDLPYPAFQMKLPGALGHPVDR